MYQKMTFGVRADNQEVILRINNADITIDYQTALHLSQELRVSGKEAKRNAGDISRTMFVSGRLSDAVANHERTVNLQQV